MNLTISQHVQFNFQTVVIELIYYNFFIICQLGKLNCSPSSMAPSARALCFGAIKMKQSINQSVSPLMNREWS